MAFTGGKEGHTSQHPDALVSLGKPNIRREIFWLSALNLKDIPYNDDSRDTLDRVNVKYVLPTTAFMSKTVTPFVQQNGFNLAKRGLFTSVI